MILETQLPELEVFRRVEKRLAFEEDAAYGPLVVASGNDRLPVHRWFRYKESFSPDLLKEVLDQFLPSVRRDIKVLDPFCGVGTTLVAAQELSAHGYSVHVTGIERNPFVAFVARAKVAWPLINAEALRSTAELMLWPCAATRSPIPTLSSFRRERCMSGYVTRRLLEVRDSIRLQGSDATHDAMLLGVASSIEALSRTRKDGRALRLVDKPRTRVMPVLESRWHDMAEDVSLLQRTIGPTTVHPVLLGDGRRPTGLGIQPGSYDLVFTSPPYPNNIDYTEVYKLELWLMGFVSNEPDFLALRKKTFRSHPTCANEPLPVEFAATIKRGTLRELLAPILTKLECQTEPWRKRVLFGYLGDLWTTLSECNKVLRDNGYAVFVVGNSLHGGSTVPYVIPTDLLLAEIAKRAGFEVESVIAGRSLKRRLPGNHFLRESLVVLRKTSG